MNEQLLKAVDSDMLDEYGETIFNAICAINRVRELQAIRTNENAAKRLKTMYTYLDYLMQKGDEIY